MDKRRLIKRRSVISIFLGMIALIAACGRAPVTTETPTAALPPAPTEPIRAASTAEKIQVFDALHEAIASSYVFEDYGGVEWEAQAEALRAALAAGMSDSDFQRAMTELVDLLPDEASSYMTRDQRIAAELEDTSIYEGIGAFVAVRSEPVPRIVLLSVIDGSPAEAAGLRAHDAIYAIDGVSVRAEEGLDVVQRVRGPAESEVVLQVASPGELRRDVIVTRRRLTATDNAKWRLLPSGSGHLLVPVLANGSLVEGVAAALEAMENQGGSPGLILDMRIAHSGTEWPLLELLTLLTDGMVGTYYNRETRSPLVVEGQDVFNSQSTPLVILVGPDTQGLPEVLAAALRANGRARIVGMQTHGQVLGYERRVLMDGSQVVFATSSFETLSGADLSRTGLAPDVPVEADWDQVTPANDPILEAAEGILISAGTTGTG